MITDEKILELLSHIGNNSTENGEVWLYGKHLSDNICSVRQWLEKNKFWEEEHIKSCIITLFTSKSPDDVKKLPDHFVEILKTNKGE